MRPTQDRVREALFSMLGADQEGARFLDLYAGSGAVGVDAWSRGAGAVCWVELDRHVHGVLRENVQRLCGAAEPGALRCVRGDVRRFLKGEQESLLYDVVFADPPYAASRSDADVGQARREELLMLVRAGRWLSEAGVVVIEERVSSEDIACEGWELLRDRTYGETRLLMFCLC